MFTIKVKFFGNLFSKIYEMLFILLFYNLKKFKYANGKRNK